MKAVGLPFRVTRTRSAAAIGRLRARWVQLAWCGLVTCLIWLLIFQARAAFAGVHALCRGEDCEAPQLTAPEMHLLHSMGISLDAYGIYTAALIVGFACVYITIAGIIIWRQPSDRMAVITAFTLALFGALVFDAPSSPQPGLPTALWAPEDVLSTIVGGYAMIAFLLLFPSGRLIHRWPLTMILPWALCQAAEALSRHAPVPPPPSSVSGATWLFMLGTVVLLLIDRYRNHSDTVERQQTKWAISGFIVAAAGMCAFALYPLSAMTGNGFLGLIAFPATQIAGLVIPLAIAIAILRYHLWDIDVLINRTLVYGSLTVCLVCVYLGCVLGLQALSRLMTGQNSDVTIAISTLAIAALFTPLRRRLQIAIDHRFYRRRYDAARTIATFQIRLRDEVDLSQLSGDLMSVVEETMQPAQVFLWLR